MPPDESLMLEELATARREHALIRETAELAAQAQQLINRVSEIHHRLAEAEDLGADGGPLRDRLSRLQLPQPSAENLETNAGQLRRAALAARVEAAAALEQRVAEWRLAIEGFDEELAKDAAWIDAVREHARKWRVASAKSAAKAKLIEVPDAAFAEVVEIAAPKPKRGAVFVLPLPEPKIEGRQSRVAMQAVIDCRADGNPFTGVSTNLSDGGLFIATENRLPPGTHVDLSFTLPGGQTIKATAVARWTRERDMHQPSEMPGIGVQFAVISTQAKSAIHRLVAERATLLAG